MDMARTRKEQPTDGELNILQVLWQRGPSRLSEICEALSQGRRVAATTVATMLKIMKGKGQVKRDDSGEEILWEATLSQKEAGSSYLQHLVNRVFDGSAGKLVLHLLEQHHLSAGEQRDIQELLAAKKGKINR